RALGREADPAVQLEALTGDALGDLAREPLRHRRLAHERLAGVVQAARVVHEQARRLDLGGAAGEAVPDGLDVADLAAELLALADVGERPLERPAREADHLAADADAPLVERLDRHLVAAADLAEHPVARHAHALEDQLAGARGADAELVLLARDREAGLV